jgi:hypothetical protein
MLKKFNLIIVLVFCTVTLCYANETIVRVDTQIGPFDLAGKLMVESQLISDFGQGYVQILQVGDEILGKKHIYYVADKKLWVEISLSHVLDKNLERMVESILVTKKELCDKKFNPKKSFGPLITSKGIKIDDPIDKVLNVYGKPTITIDIAKDKLFSALVENLKLKNGKVLRYLTSRTDELFFAEFYFNEERLHSLLISASE